ncbi:sigma-54 interaction domain-containing protein [Paenactinomyces guangxiensis]|uniref:Sigma 54-interacting transcriptional regulator n=1 Tax=Paenactinomyces guangxiensis TaxID=1490290 RepID=A0A7W2A7Z3_9BACL|nr:sigma 54-interacting transcriptional regulator [Paenactinomyces guangxiensis]MBA4493308.1 sigma 54-interacting transcriptional regulator [Paenactinomyces guangxiensis]MBH8589841.1 sigma 54-interacting transcriptional regulator [Paenactinomyces guangxiensis]
MDTIEQLKKERKKLLHEVEALLTMIATPVLVVDREGAVIHTNTVAENVWRRSPITLMNKRLPELIEPAKLLKLVQQGKPVKDFPVQIIDAAGIHHPYMCRIHPLYVNKHVERAVLQFTQPVLQQGSERDRKYTTRYTFSDIRGNSPAITELKVQAQQVAKSDSTILIRGESGTGKEVLAQAIHAASHRMKGPFVALNCAAIPESLLESELFGYEEGAFTGAKKGGKPGRFELARGGTLFLDEIGDMPLFLQAKLLRVLQERRVERIGGSESIPVDVRVIAATHKDLEAMIAKQQFREDLYFRLNVIPLYIPPLRERKEDLYGLVDFYMKKFADRLGKETKRLSSQVWKKFYEYHWPGNIRELENIIEYIVNLEIGDLVTMSSLPASLRENAENENGTDQPLSVWQNKTTLDPSPLKIEETEEYLIQQALRRFGTSTEGKRKAAEALGISLATLYRRLQRYHREKKFSK